jgi:hypothetical protein
MESPPAWLGIGSWGAAVMLASRLETLNLLRAKAICNLKFEISNQAKRGGSWGELFGARTFLSALGIKI